LVTVLPAWFAIAQKPGTAPRRAEPPKFDRSDFDGVFFDDLFGDQGPLVGARPQTSTVAAAPGGAAGGGAAPGTAAGSGGGEVSGAGWSELISETTIEDEIKSLNLEVQKTVTTPAQFAGRGHKAAQKQFSMLAMLFAIIGEYGQDVRFKEDAPALRDRFARAAANTKAGGNIQVYNEAKLRRDDLAEVIRGSKLNAGGEPKANWEAVVSRSPIMRILEDRSVKYLQQSTASEAEFKREPEKVLHEAELVAAMAHALKQDGMDDAGDEEYESFLAQMKKGAIDAIAAVKLNNAEQARLAVGEMRKSCDACHELYR
jgi:hypothetical protein